MSEVTFLPGVKEHEHRKKSFLRMLFDPRTEGCLTHLKIFARSSPQKIQFYFASG